MPGHKTPIDGEIDANKDYTRAGAMKAFGYGTPTLIEWEELGLPWYVKCNHVRYRGADLIRFGRMYAEKKSPNFDETESREVLAAATPAGLTF